MPAWYATPDNGTRGNVRCPHCFWLFDAPRLMINQSKTVECPRDKAGCCLRSLTFNRRSMDFVKITHSFSDGVECCVTVVGLEPETVEA